MKKKNNPAPENAQGYTDEEGNYVPTEAEVRENWPDIGPDRDLSRDDFRMKIWRHPPTRNLVPFYTTEEAQAKQLGSAKARKSKLRKYKDDKAEKSMLLDILKEELDNDQEDLDPYKLLQLRAKMAVMAEDWDKVEYLSMAMLEFVKPKLARIESKNENIEMGSANVEDMKDFLDGKITYEEFLKKQKGE